MDFSTATPMTWSRIWRLAHTTQVAFVCRHKRRLYFQNVATGELLVRRN